MPEGASDPGTAGRLRRPIDIDPETAERIGRAALAKLGYIPIINLAREAGWVTRKKREGIRAGDPSLLAQVPAGGDFVEVFSKYALIAGVTSQSDTVLPGPGDVAAIGILVLGLIDAALLAGAVARAIEAAATTTTAATTSSPPIATTMPMATTTPTVDAPPIPVPWTETDEEKEKRCQKVKDMCIAECNSRMGEGFRPARPGKGARGHPGGGTNFQAKFYKCIQECIVDEGC